METLIHYPIPPFLSGTYAGYTVGTDLSISIRVTKELLSLPLFPGMQLTQVDYVIE